MAASCTHYDSSSLKGEYVISNASELYKLPTTTKYGEEELTGYAKCIHGSECVCLNPVLSVYFLDGDTDTWVKRG